jgi:hypothetical protein
MTLRKGQKIANWIREQGWKDIDARRILFYMSDEQFEQAINFEGPYGVNEKSLWGKDGAVKGTPQALKDVWNKVMENRE